MKIIDLGKAVLLIFLIIFGVSLATALLLKIRPDWNEPFLKIIRDLLIIGSILWYTLHAHLVQFRGLNFKLDGLALGVGLIVMIGSVLLEPDQGDSIKLLPYQVLQVLIFAPIMEEVICRGVIFGNYASEQLVIATLVSTVLFVALHFSTNLIEIVEFVLISLILCYVQFKTENVLNCIVLHSLLNLSLLIGSRFLQ
ncbi:CPBP family intramembrane glutamic endopeptidase [Fructilactobacillus carniphilus]|uniref:CPBP family intramembrane metalloprotease n=1 Tax=Fructilactobacillus carniphilus TaxID=2940297 RepID=A0ABY5BVL5_9LACO|nr:CPBP family intramembrane glutamic endopeptidase [Fructilactobacillus carniphilus]USS90546.1 CPBP family intramembrane metalloprotease [Fructilactobacillus carniphilus]